MCRVFNQIEELLLTRILIYFRLKLKAKENAYKAVCPIHQSHERKTSIYQFCKNDCSYCCIHVLTVVVIYWGKRYSRYLEVNEKLSASGILRKLLSAYPICCTNEILLLISFLLYIFRHFQNLLLY